MLTILFWFLCGMFSTVIIILIIAHLTIKTGLEHEVDKIK